MRAMVLERAGDPLRERQPAGPEPAAGEVLLRVRACGVCRTELHILDGDLAEPKLPERMLRSVARLRAGRLRGAAVLEIR